MIEDQTRSYDEVRKARKQARKDAKRERKANKPRGIDFPWYKAMPAPLLAFFLLIAVVTLVLVVVVMLKPPTPTIAVSERRSPPGQTVSHNVGPIVLAPIPSPLPPTNVNCGAVRGVVIEGGEPAQVRIGGVLERMCPHVTGDTDFAKSVRALSKARIRFARFARSGDNSTLSVADPVRVLVNVQFARRDLSAMWIAPLLAHEGFHLVHAGEPWTAALEFDARAVELEACKLLIPVDGWSRGCNDARQLVEFGKERGVDALVKAGFPR